MKKLISVIVVLAMALLVTTSYAGTVSIGDTEMKYDSIEDLQAAYAAIRECMVAEYKTILFDADTYNGTTYIVGETFPAGRYYVYPVVVSEKNTDLYAILYWWSKEEINEFSCTGHVCAEWCRTVELTDGMKIQFSWDGDQRGVCIAMQKSPQSPASLMDIFD